MVLDFVTDTESKSPAKAVNAFFWKQELKLRTYIKRKLERRNCCKIGFKTNLTSNSDTKTVVSAETCFNTGTGIPTQPIVDSTCPLIHASQIEEVEIGKIYAQVKLSTIVAQSFLKRDFSTIAGTTAKTKTNGILSVSCKGQTHHCN